MKNFTLIATGIDVAPLLAELDVRPELWNENPARLTCISPHRETQDIWVRYRDKSELHGPDDYRTEHRSVWYPACEALPSMKRTVSGRYLQSRPDMNMILTPWACIARTQLITAQFGLSIRSQSLAS